MKSEYIWLIAGGVVLYMLYHSQAQQQQMYQTQEQIDAATNRQYASDATNIIEDLF